MHLLIALAALGGAGLGHYLGIESGGGPAWTLGGALVSAVLAGALHRRPDPGRATLVGWAAPGLLLLEPLMSAGLQLPAGLLGPWTDPVAAALMVRRYVGGVLLVLSAGGCAAAFGLSSSGGWAGPRRAARWVALVSLMTAALFAALACLAYQAFHKYVDLAIENEVVWHLSRGQGPVTHIHESLTPAYHPVYWSYHLTLMWALVAPLYRLWSSPCLLLILQAALVCGAAIPIYGLLKPRVGEGQAAGLALAYLLYPTTQHAMLHDLHGLSWAVPFTAGLWWAVRERRWVLAAACGLLALSCREEACLVLAGMGLALLLTPGRRAWGALFLAGSLALFLILVNRVMPSLGASADWRTYKFGELGRTNAEILTSLVTHPIDAAGIYLKVDKLGNAALFLLPLAGLPLLGGRATLVALPLFAAIFLSTNPAAYCYLLFYTLPAAPFLFLGAGEGLLRLERWGGAGLRRAGWLAILACSLAATVVFGPSPLGRTFWQKGYALGIYAEAYHHRSVYAQTEHARRGRDLLERIPSSASVSAQDFFLPHLARVRRLRILTDTVGADFVLLDQSHPNRYHLPEPGRYEALVRSLRGDPAWRCVVDEDGYLLFGRLPSVSCPVR